MSTPARALRRTWSSVLTLLLVLTAAMPGGATGPAADPSGQAGLSEETLSLLSQSVAVRFWLDHPQQAPLRIRAELRGLRASVDEESPASTPETVPLAVTSQVQFNQDATGLPQREESVSVCRSNPNIVLGGTNDLRALVSTPANLGGWQLSTDGGATVAKEGLLPAVTVAAATVPSSGDPVVGSDSACNLLASNLAVNFTATGATAQSAIAAYRTTATTLTGAACTFNAPACWPTTAVVASTTNPSELLDKEWMDVGTSGAAGEVAWFSYTDFINAPTVSSSIKAVRCTATLSACTAPILISGLDPLTQFSYVTIGPDGRTFLSWARVDRNAATGAQTFTIKLRIAAAGATEFGATQTVAVVTSPIPFGGRLTASDFRVATQPKNAVRIVNGKPRIFVTWDSCSQLVANLLCEEPVINLAFSDDDGITWTQKVLSTGGDNFFPTIANDAAATGTKIAVAWYTTGNDTSANHRYDVTLASVDPVTAAAVLQRVTSVSNEPDANPLGGGLFIGDYFQVFAHAGTAYIHFNANYTKMRFLGSGLPILQQDNFLAKVTF